MSALGLELGDDDDGQDHLVLVEAQQGVRVSQQHARVEDEGALAVGCCHVGFPLHPHPTQGQQGADSARVSSDDRDRAREPVAGPLSCSITR